MVPEVVAEAEKAAQLIPKIGKRAIVEQRDASGAHGTQIYPSRCKSNSDSAHQPGEPDDTDSGSGFRCAMLDGSRDGAKADQPS
jgi:hypothetical protein